VVPRTGRLIHVGRCGGATVEIGGGGAEDLSGAATSMAQKTSMAR
jgi:hypothetical protein